MVDVGSAGYSYYIMKINADGIAIVKKFEGCSLTSYVCPGGYITIGYGHRNPKLRLGMKITEQEAERLLIADLTRFEDAITKKIKVDINSNQFSALVSFAYNVGCGALFSSTLWKILNKKQYIQASSEFMKWVHAGGRELPGLKARRTAERALFLKKTA